jgi:hypothetical protein
MAKEKDKPGNAPENPQPERERQPQADYTARGAVATLLRDYEDMVGNLEKVEPRKLRRDDGKLYEWPWSWNPDTAVLFLSDWDSALFMAHPLLKELAVTLAPDGRRMMYERACSPKLRQAIDNALGIDEQPIGAIRPVPRGKAKADLRATPINMRPTVFTLNHWHFTGGRIHENLDPGLAMQLEEMHGKWYAEGMRVFETHDHPTTDLGIVSRTVG